MSEFNIQEFSEAKNILRDVAKESYHQRRTPMASLWKPPN